MKLNRLGELQFESQIPNSMSAEDESQVSVPMAEILPVISEAFQNGLQWIRDFDDDHVQIPRDMMDLIQRIKKL